MTSQYEELLAEETFDLHQPKAAKSIRQTVFVVWVILCLTIMVSAIGLAVTKPWVPESSSLMNEYAESSFVHASRATGDQYSIGVGKADITGFVHLNVLSDDC